MHAIWHVPTGGELVRWAGHKVLTHIGFLYGIWLVQLIIVRFLSMHLITGALGCNVSCCLHEQIMLYDVTMQSTYFMIKLTKFAKCFFVKCTINFTIRIMAMVCICIKGANALILHTVWCICCCCCTDHNGENSLLSASQGWVYMKHYMRCCLYIYTFCCKFTFLTMCRPMLRMCNIFKIDQVL